VPPQRVPPPQRVLPPQRVDPAMPARIFDLIFMIFFLSEKMNIKLGRRGNTQSPPSFLIYSVN
jgi:hypothetical protein